MSTTGVDVLMGIGGTPEAVLAACALKGLGGDMQAKLFIRDEEERKAAIEAGVTDLDRVLTLDDLVRGDDTYFAATGITTGEFLQGVSFGANNGPDPEYDSVAVGHTAHRRDPAQHRPQAAAAHGRGVRAWVSSISSFGFLVSSFWFLSFRSSFVFRGWFCVIWKGEGRRPAVFATAGRNARRRVPRYLSGRCAA